MSYFSDVVEQIKELKKSRGNDFGQSEQLITAHLSSVIDQIEYIEKKGKVVAFIEWHAGIPNYDGLVLKGITPDPGSIFVANIVVESFRQMAYLCRKMLRANPEAKTVYWHNRRTQKKVQMTVRESWRIG